MKKEITDAIMVQHHQKSEAQKKLIEISKNVEKFNDLKKSNSCDLSDLEK